MEMVSSAISNLPRFVRRRDILPDVNGGFGRSSLSRYGSSDLASPDQSWIVSHGCHEEVCPRNIYPGYYVDNVVRLFVPGISVVVLLPMLLD